MEPCSNSSAVGKSWFESHSLAIYLCDFTHVLISASAS